MQTTTTLPCVPHTPLKAKLLTLLLAVLVACVLPQSAALAQSVAWSQRVVGGPSARNNPAMAYDAARGVTVLFGGYNNGILNAETWEWNGVGGGGWTQRLVNGPSARDGHAMAYDAARGVTVLFGGYTGTYNSETWEWNGTAWTQRLVAGPSGRVGHAMAYDAARGVTVLFGGNTGSRNGDETWEWNGTAWTRRVVSGPSVRSFHAMAYDAARGVTVLFGGYNVGYYYAETWEWNGTGGGAWTRRVVGGPSERGYHAMAYDAARGVTVLFGGHNHITGYNAETWEWNGTGDGAWTQRLVSGPSARASLAMAYDAERGVTVLFGGGRSISNADTWELGMPCSPSISTQPSTQTTCPSGTAIFSVTATGTGPFTYQWEWQPAGAETAWVGLAEGNNAEFGGVPVVHAANVGTATLEARPLAGYINFAPRAFRCVVTNACAPTPPTGATSNGATLTVCPADFNCDGFLDFFDYSDFVECFETGVCGEAVGADFNGDGFVDFFDYDDFVLAFETGC